MSAHRTQPLRLRHADRPATRTSRLRVAARQGWAALAWAWYAGPGRLARLLFGGVVRAIATVLLASAAGIAAVALALPAPAEPTPMQVPPEPLPVRVVVGYLEGSPSPTPPPAPPEPMGAPGGLRPTP